ncbi:shikimate O-hydroxycinnamoyltransferase-like protein [Carex littledalei]|uniref:Shikimate O-hydroxycinnamoyltransferase-like protein n=1 Tax=Carex littledalei TaxID=544730 RepID=A0A833RMC7_9POAL|nr:shikimate O-hydroxycinnamoyltransferase-like protein [Carex littledalei]
MNLLFKPKLMIDQGSFHCNGFSFAPSSEVRNLYVPPGGQQDSACIPLLVQVTFFKCGGVALGTASHHQVVDGRSAFHFTETWSRIACGEDSCIVPPFFDHTLLAARPDRKVMFNHFEYKSNPKSIIPSGISTLYASSVLEMSNKHIDALNHVAKMVHEATKHGDDYARSLIDYLETAGMENLPRSGVPISELRVISLLGMPTDKANFGWGKPIFCAPAYYSGYIYLMDSPRKEAGVSAVVLLEPENMSDNEFPPFI